MSKWSKVERIKELIFRVHWRCIESDTAIGDQTCTMLIYSYKLLQNQHSIPRDTRAGGYRQNLTVVVKSLHTWT